jgi:hypothetical protein
MSWSEYFIRALANEPGKSCFSQSTPRTRLCAIALQRAGAKGKQEAFMLQPFTLLVLLEVFGISLRP